MKNVVQKIGIWGDSLLKGVIFDEVLENIVQLKNVQ